MITIIGVGAALLVAITFATFMAFYARPKRIEAKSQQLAQTCAPLGLSVAAHPKYPRLESLKHVCSGELAGVRIMVIRGKTLLFVSDASVVLQLVVDTGLYPGSRGFLYRLGKDSPEPSGTEEDVAKLRRLISADVRAEAKGMENLGLRPTASLLQGSALDLAITARWPDGWGTVALIAELPEDASTPAIQSGLSQMLRVRAVLRQAAGEP